jgi:outer membrane receptor for ferrienterochelin and colicins
VVNNDCQRLLFAEKNEFYKSCKTMKIKILVIILAFASPIYAQILRGGVSDEKGQPIVGAHVFWMDKSAEVLSDENGKFELPRKTNSTMLHIEFVGFEKARRIVKIGETDVSITLREPKKLDAVTVTGKRGDNSVSSLDARNVEKISSMELRKAPCCNLSESFETNGTVDIQYADAVTGAKEIQMLGLRGIYTQLLVENRPDFYGLAQPFALEYIPGTWLKDININKGVGSVKNGMQGMTGQINSTLVDLEEQPPLFVNLYAENTQRVEANVHVNKIHSEKFGWQVLAHGSTFQNKIDRDNDKFVDMPLKTQINVMPRFFYRDKTIEAQLFLHGLSERRESGQLIESQSIRKPFLIDIENNRASATLKLGYLGFAKPYNSLGTQWSATWHNVAANYGKNRYGGTQRSYYSNVIYQTIIGTTDHKIQYGGSFQYDDYTEKLNDADLSRVDALAGAFTEYVYNRPSLKGYNDWTIVAGLRGDVHQKFGLFVSPRLNLKYNFNEGDVVRFAAGRGVRVANPIAENVSFLATNRAIVVDPNLKPEDAWNFGLSGVKTFKIFGGREARLNVDLFRTWFNNQVIADIESNFDKAQFYNLDGKSYSNTVLTMLNAELLRGLDIKLAYKFNDVRATYKGKLDETPLVPRHRGLVSATYKTPNKKWMVNVSTTLVGSQRLADRSYTPPQYLHHFYARSPRYSLTHVSINYFLKKIELYGGSENLLNYTQTTPHPIIAHTDPESIYFDATQVFAPMMGRRIYAGLRWRIGEKN